jgi:hypothetical protein
LFVVDGEDVDNFGTIHLLNQTEEYVLIQYVYVCVHMYIYTYICVYICILMYMYTYVYVYICMYVSLFKLLRGSLQLTCQVMLDPWKSAFVKNEKPRIKSSDQAQDNYFDDIRFCSIV